MDKYKNSFQIRVLSANGDLFSTIKFNYDNDEVCRNADNKLNNIDIASRFCLLNYDRTCIVESLTTNCFIIYNPITMENVGNPFFVVEDWEYRKIKENELVNNK